MELKHVIIIYLVGCFLGMIPSGLIQAYFMGVLDLPLDSSTVLILALFWFLFCLLFMVWFIYSLYKDMKARSLSMLWMIVVLFGGVIGIIVYYFVNKDKPLNTLS